MKKINLGLVVLIGFCFAACQEQQHLPMPIDDVIGQTATPLTSSSGQNKVAVYGNVHHQVITGLGASSAWYYEDLPTEAIDQLYNKKTGLGLHILRVRVAPGGTCYPGEIAAAQQVSSLGGLIWATPWSPPAEWKSNNNTDNGGTLLPKYYQVYAEQLVGFIGYMAAQNVKVDYLSAQNEPDYTAPWESCLFSPNQLVTFVGNYLGPAMKKAGLTTKLIAPETSGFELVSTYTQAFKQNPQAWQYVDVVATHDYDGTIAADLATTMAKKPFWMTEFYISNNTNNDSLSLGLQVAERIHDSFVNANINAWHYWWVQGIGNSQSGLWQNNMPSYRAIAMGHFSKFLQPPFVRHRLAQSGSNPNVLISEYSNSKDSNFVVVAINTSNSNYNFELQLDWQQSELTPYLTHSNLRLAMQPKVAAKTTTSALSQFSLTIAPQSIVTWVGNRL